MLFRKRFHHQNILPRNSCYLHHHQLVNNNSNSLRFSSSSSSSSSGLTLPQLKNLALCAIPPNGTWMRLSDVARELPDDFFDSLPEDCNGLRGLLEQCNPETEALISFRKGTQLEVSRLPPKILAQQQKQQQQEKKSEIKRTTSFEKVRNISDIMQAPPPPPQTESIAASKLDRVAIHEAQQQQISKEMKEQRRLKHEEALKRVREEKQRRQLEFQKAKELAAAAKVSGAAAATKPSEVPYEIKEQISSELPVDQIEIERALLGSLTIFPINIVEAALDHHRLIERQIEKEKLGKLQQHQQKPDDDSNSPETIGPLLQQAKASCSDKEIFHRVAEFVSWIEPVSHMIDLFHTSSNPWKTLKDELKSYFGDGEGDEGNNNNSNSKKDFFDNFYISILLPFQTSHAPLDGPEKFAIFKAQEYDMYRLARYLSTTFFVSVSSLLESDTQDILEKPILQVIASYPNHFEYVHANGAKFPEHEQYETKPVSVYQVVRAAAEEYDLPLVKVHRRKNTTPTTSSAVDEMELNHRFENNVSDEFGFVRFILSPEEFSTATKCSLAFKNASLEELEKTMALILRGGKHSVPPADAPLEDLGPLKAFPAGPRRQSAKQECRRAINLKKFPRGNVFFDRNVLSHYIFDTIPPEEAISFEAYKREFLGARAKNTAPMYGNFPQNHPHLFHAFQDEKNEWYLQRADSQHLVKVKNVEEVTEAEVIQAMMIAKPKKIDRFRPMTTSTVTYKMSKLLQKAVKQKFAGIIGIVKRNPHLFTLIDEKECLFLYNDEITQEVCERMGLVPVADEQQQQPGKKVYRLMNEKEFQQLVRSREKARAAEADKKEKEEKEKELESSVDVDVVQEKNEKEQLKIPEGENLWDHFAAEKK